MKYFINYKSDSDEFTYIYNQSIELSKSEKNTATTVYVNNEPQFCNETVGRYDVVEINEQQYIMLRNLNASGDDKYYDEALNIIDKILYPEV